MARSWTTCVGLIVAAGAVLSWSSPPAGSATVVSGDGQKTLDGTYGDSLGVSTYTFKEDGTVTVSLMGGVQIKYNYQLDGDTVRLTTPYGGSMVFKLRQNGSLQGPPGVLTKQKSAASGGQNAGGKAASRSTAADAPRLS